MAYIVTPGYGLKLADPATIQQFETAVVNADFLALENAILAETARALAVEAPLTAGAGRGSGARYVFASLALLDPVATALVGDTAQVTLPGTGIDPLNYRAITGAAAAIDWMVDGTVVADTKANLDAFIAAQAALVADFQFQIGALAYVKATRIFYRFTSTAGALKATDAMVPMVPTSVVGTGVVLNPDGSVTLTGGTVATLSINGCRTAEFENYFDLIDVTLSSSAVLQFRYRTSGGADASGASDYTLQMLAVINTAATASTIVSSAGTLGNLTASEHFLEVTTRSPNKARTTWWSAKESAINGAAHAFGDTRGRHILTTLYDSISLIPGAGTISALTWRSWGYNDN